MTLGWQGGDSGYQDIASAGCHLPQPWSPTSDWSNCTAHKHTYHNSAYTKEKMQRMKKRKEDVVLPEVLVDGDPEWGAAASSGRR
jgi:hypothetical protein